MANGDGFVLLLSFLVGLILVVLPIAWLLNPFLGAVIAVTAGLTLVFGLVFAVAIRGGAR